MLAHDLHKIVNFILFYVTYKKDSIKNQYRYFLYTLMKASTILLAIDFTVTWTAMLQSGLIFGRSLKLILPSIFYERRAFIDRNIGYRLFCKKKKIWGRNIQDTFYSSRKETNIISCSLSMHLIFQTNNLEGEVHIRVEL